LLDTQNASAHLAQGSAGIGINPASLKLTRTNQTDRNRTDLLCFVYIYIPKESVTEQSLETIITANGFLAFDIVHAVEFSRIGRSWFSPQCGFYPGPYLLFVVFVAFALAPGNLSNLPLSFRLSNRRVRLEIRIPPL